MSIRVCKIGSGRGCLLVHHGACYNTSTLALLSNEKPQELSASLAGIQTAGDPGSSPISPEVLTEMGEWYKFDGRIDLGDGIDEKVSGGQETDMTPGFTLAHVERCLHGQDNIQKLF